MIELLDYIIICDDVPGFTRDKKAKVTTTLKYCQEHCEKYNECAEAVILLDERIEMNKIFNESEDDSE